MPTALKIVRAYFPKVTSVVDAKKKVDVEVNGHDQSVARRKSHRACAMAVACKRKMALDGVIISIRTAYLVKGEVATRYGLPQSVQREIVSFDRGSGFQSGEYEMIPPEHKLGAAPRGKAHGSSRSPGEGLKHARHTTQGIRTVLGSRKAMAEEA